MLAVTAQQAVTLRNEGYLAVPFTVRAVSEKAGKDDDDDDEEEEQHHQQQVLVTHGEHEERRRRGRREEIEFSRESHVLAGYSTLRFPVAFRPTHPVEETVTSSVDDTVRSSESATGSAGTSLASASRPVRQRLKFEFGANEGKVPVREALRWGSARTFSVDCQVTATVLCCAVLCCAALCCAVLPSLPYTTPFALSLARSSVDTTRFRFCHVTSCVYVHVFHVDNTLHSKM